MREKYVDTLAKLYEYATTVYSKKQYTQWYTQIQWAQKSEQADVSSQLTGMSGTNDFNHLTQASDHWKYETYNQK